MRVQRCKGSRDLSSEQMTRFRLIEESFRDCSLKSGYKEVRTPTLEYLHLFTSTGTLTPGMLSRVYSFLDWDGWSGERVVLRPDGTIPVARLYIDSMAENKLARLFYVTNIFIFEPTGKETRERWQCGAELIGVGSTIADVELITLALEVLKRLGIGGIELRLSHAGLIRALLAKLGLNPGDQTKVFDQILDGDVEALSRIKAGRPELGEALSLLLNSKGKSSGFLKNLKALFTQNLAELEPPIDDFISIVDFLDALDCNYQIDITSGKGFEYYTGVIYQFFIGDEKVAGGGRYDALIPLMGGKDTPASGFALYIDRLMNLVKPEILAKPAGQRILIRAQSEAVKDSFTIASRLREAGNNVVELNLGGQEPTDFGWTLDVQSKAPIFILTDQIKHKEFKLQTVDELLKLL